MRLTTILLIVSLMQVSASGLAQRVTLNKSNVTLSSVLKDIRTQTGYDFYYDNKTIPKSQQINISVTNGSIEEALNVAFKGLKLKYDIDGKIITISKAEEHASTNVVSTLAQKKEISGKVVDKDGVGLYRANIMIKGTTIGVSAGQDGKFTLTIPDNLANTAVLEVSFTGYTTKLVKVGNQTEITITLELEANQLKDITVVAYGERTKEKLINSVTSVKASDIKDMPSSNLENLLQGQMAGVAVTNRSGSPGGTGSIVNIRGQNSLMVTDREGKLINTGSPLYVVDGIPIISENNVEAGVSGLADIDPATIESVEVLKDASATALYGSRANNGVILITTKKGKTGKAQVTANVSMGFNILPKTAVQTIGKAERDLGLLFAKNSNLAYQDRTSGTYIIPGSYADAVGTTGSYDYFWGNGVPAANTYSPALQDSLNPYYNNSSNWWDYYFQTGKTVSANVEVSGGTELSKYNISFGHYDEQGIMVGAAFKRYNVTANMNFTPRKNLTISSNNYFAYTNRGKGGNSNNGSATLVGSPKSSSSLFSFDNPIALKQSERIASTQEKNNTYRLRSGLAISLNLAKNLKFTSSPAVDFSLVTRNIFSPAALDDQYGLAKSENYTSKNIMLNWENLLKYNFSIKEAHNFEILAGQGITKNIKETADGTGRGMASDDIHYVPLIPDEAVVIDQNGASVVSRNFSSSFSTTYLLSYFGRFAYDYEQKYLLEATIRADGSSTFGSGKRWGTFPSVAVGWNFSKEAFMQDVWWLSLGKIRASRGVTGLQFQNPYLAHGTVSDANSPYFLGVPGLAPDVVSYNNLAWEKSTQYGVGLDLDLFDYRLKVVADYYYKLNEDQIYNAPFPGDVYYLSSTWRNTFSSSNRGIEIGLQYDVLRNQPLKWRTRLNIAKNSNRFEKSYNGNDVNSFILGRPLMGYTVYIQDGYVNNKGDVPLYYNPNGTYQYLSASDNFHPVQVGMKKLLDLNNDGKINELDKAFVGSPIPQISGGWINEFSWKNFQLATLFSFVISQDVINALPYTAYINGRTPQTTLIFDNYSSSNYWNADDFEKYGNNYSPMFPVPNVGYSPQADVMVNSNIENVSYIRLKKLSLSYTFNKSLMQKLRLSSARLFATGENLGLITNYSGLDPEAIPFSGIDNLDNYPLARTYTLGCVLGF